MRRKTTWAAVIAVVALIAFGSGPHDEETATADVQDDVRDAQPAIRPADHDGLLADDKPDLSGPSSPILDSTPAPQSRTLYDNEILVKFDMATGECVRGDRTVDGVTTTRTVCASSLTFDHPYDAFSYEQLMQIHETDAIASYILGMKTFHDSNWRRHFDYEASVNHLHRAATLSGKAQPYLDMLRSRGLHHDSRPSSEFLRRESYVWYEAGIRAGVIRMSDKPEWMKNLASTVSIADRIDWDSEAEHFAQMMVDLRAHKTGESF